MGGAPVQARLHNFMEQGIATGVFPGGVLLVQIRGRVAHLSTHGVTSRFPPGRPVRANTCFDLASLTKVLAVSGLVLDRIQAGRLGLSDKVLSHLPPLPARGWSRMTVRHLLEHSSGLAAWRAYHHELAAHAGGTWLKTRRAKQAVRRMVAAERLQTPPGTRAEYSDLGFILLEWILEQVSGRPMQSLFKERLAGRLRRGRLFFVDLKRPGKHPKVEFAASERCPWRGHTLFGEVHDDNAWAVGGISGQAGLFGDARGVAGMATCWLDSYHGRATFFHRDGVRRFFRRSQVSGSHRALGFDTPSRGCSAGRRLGPQSVGHTGFTGTSLWIDPERELIVVLLTNRVHPTRNNQAIQAFRPGLHDLVVDCLETRRT